MDALALQRLSNRLHKAGVPVAPRALRRAIQLLFGSVLPAELEVGEGTQLGYGGLGVVIHGAAKIGRNCLIAQQVTIGGKGAGGVPTIGDGVLIGAGAKVLGPIHVGDGALIGANAVVLRDVPPGCTVGGIPARILATSDEARTAFRRSMQEQFGVDPGAIPLAAAGQGRGQE